MTASIAIVDYGVGNLFSVARACEAGGLSPIVTSDASVIDGADGVVLPGIGAFANAMAAISRLKLIDCLRSLPARGTPLFGVCLGMQLLMEQSEEFGVHEGLGLIAGSVVPLHPIEPVKVPHVGWSAVRPPRDDDRAWRGSVLDGLSNDEPMYFVHSYVVAPRDPDVAVAETRYGGQRFVSAVASSGVAGVQFHPERSGPAGLRIYRNLAEWVSGRKDVHRVEA